MKLFKLVGEATEYEKKVSLERKKPKSWCKTVSAFANGKGGYIVFGIDDDNHMIGVENTEEDIDVISDFMQSKLDPMPTFHIETVKEEGKDFILLKVEEGKVVIYIVNNAHIIYFSQHILNIIRIKCLYSGHNSSRFTKCSR